MTVSVYWGRTLPMVCQVCRRPVRRWESEVILGYPRDRLGLRATLERCAVAFAALCHGAVEVRYYPLEDDDWVDGLHPAVAFPMPG